ncbi:MAG: hypothetical protein KF874_13970 [Rhizobiaceae bacterium]|nr:hypothetical protein [Rhizobiaceae bacterium]
MFTGNRGTLHDPDTKRLTGRRWTTRTWIICLCEFKGRKRQVFGRNARSGGTGYTNLFFLDEVTALAAGHRPCFECRRADAQRYLSCFSEGNSLGQIKAAQMDEVLHSQRIAANNSPPILARLEIEKLPDGTVVLSDGHFLVRRSGSFLRWSFDGYSNAENGPTTAQMLTPPGTVAALSAGYKPIWHSSA